MRVMRLSIYWLCSLSLAGCMAAADDRANTTNGSFGQGSSAGTPEDGNGGSGGADGASGGDGSSGASGAAGAGANGMSSAGMGVVDDEDGGVASEPGSTGGTDAGGGDSASNGVASDDVPTGSHCAPVLAWDPQWAQFEEEVLVLTNQARAVGHNCDSDGNFGPAPALSMEPHLRCSARLHSQYMADVGDDFAHTQRETGLDPFERMQAAGYRFLAGGENIAVGQTSPQEVVDGWLESDGHCSNIMSPNFTQIGVGYDFGPYDSGFGQSFDAPYWTQNFGKPM